MANLVCPACTLPNPETYAKCRRCGTALIAPGPGGGAWRDGKVLVLKLGAALPDRCVRCGAPARGQGLKRTFYWHPPLLYLLVLPALLIYAIVALVVRKQAIVFVGLCPSHVQRYRQAVWGSSLAALSGVVLLVLAIGGGGMYGWPGLLLLLGGAVWGSLGARLLTPARIDDQFVRLRGAAPQFLQQLPAWSATV